MVLKYYSNVSCPLCGHVNNVKIPETMGLSWIECESCKQKVMGKENHHGGAGVFCTYGDVPGLQIQEQESKEIK